MRVFVAERYLDLLSRSSYLMGERGSAKKKSLSLQSQSTQYTQITNTHTAVEEDRGAEEKIERKRKD